MTDMREKWDALARENAVGAICWHATEEEFERRGQEDARYLLAVLRAWVREGPGCCLKRAAVLDLGGGIGRVAKHLAGFVLKYHLVDVSGEMLERARERLGPAVESGRIVLHQCDGYGLGGLDIPEASVDFGFCDLVFQHMDREVAVSYLMDLRRLLKPGAWFWMQVPAMLYPARFAEAKRGDWPANLRRWQPGELLELCVRLGYRILAADCDSMQVVLENGKLDRGRPVAPWEAEAGIAWLPGRTGQ